MSIFHLTVRSVSRASGRSAVAAAAYRAGERLTNDRDGRTHDYTNKPVVEAFILAPPDAPEWSRDRARLWNAVEVAEKRKDAKVAREYELALPAEVDAAGRRRLAETFGWRLVERYGVAVDVAIHPPSEEGDQRNHHAHLLTTTRLSGQLVSGPRPACSMSQAPPPSRLKRSGKAGRIWSTRRWRGPTSMSASITAALSDRVRRSSRRSSWGRS